jgi:hypothetical protein
MSVALSESGVQLSRYPGSITIRTSSFTSWVKRLPARLVHLVRLQAGKPAVRIFSLGVASPKPAYSKIGRLLKAATTYTEVIQAPLYQDV